MPVPKISGAIVDIPESRDLMEKTQILGYTPLNKSKGMIQRPKFSFYHKEKVLESRVGPVQ